MHRRTDIDWSFASPLREVFCLRARTRPAIRRLWSRPLESINDSVVLSGYVADDVGDVHLKYVESMGYWMTDQLDAPVIQYTFRELDEAEIGDGRLYYQTGRYVADEWVSFREGFIEFAESLFKWVRREFTRSTKSGLYVGPAAREVGNTED